MKFILIILVMIIIQTTISGAGNVYSQTNNSVFFEVQLAVSIKEIPYLIIEDHLIDQPEVKFDEEKMIKPYESKGNTYFFDLPDIKDAAYFSIAIDIPDMRIYLMKDYHYEPGDNVEIKVAADNSKEEAYDLSFTGIGSGKYRCVNELQYCISHLKMDDTSVFTEVGEYNPKNSYSMNIAILNDVVEKYQPEMSDYSDALLRTDMEAQQEKNLIAVFYKRLYNTLATDNIPLYLKTAEGYRIRFQLVLKMIPDRIKYESKEYAGFLLDRMVTDYLEKYTRVSFVSIYSAVKQIEHIALRDKMLVHLFLKHSMDMREDYRMLVEAAIKSVQNSTCRHTLEILADHGPASIL